MVMGSVSSPEETMQLQSTLSFMRENDGKDRMTVQSFRTLYRSGGSLPFPQ